MNVIYKISICQIFRESVAYYNNKQTYISNHARSGVTFIGYAQGQKIQKPNITAECNHIENV